MELCQKMSTPNGGDGFMTAQERKQMILGQLMQKGTAYINEQINKNTAENKMSYKYYLGEEEENQEFIDLITKHYISKGYKVEYLNTYEKKISKTPSFGHKLMEFCCCVSISEIEYLFISWQ
jgi:hypothetical protein